MSRPALSIASFSLAAVLVCAALTHADTRALLAEGSNDISWIAREELSDDKKIQTLIQSRRIGSGTVEWKLIGVLNARAISLTHTSGRLGVLLESGDWSLIWENGSAGGVQPADGSKLIRLAAAGDTLWAIGIAGKGRSPTTAAATQSATSMPTGTLLLYRLEKGQWQRIAPLPKDIAADELIAFGVSGNAPVLATLRAVDVVKTFEFVIAGSTWRTWEDLAAPTGTTRIKWLDGVGRPMLWMAGPAGSGAIASHDGKWSSPVPLAVTGQAPTGPSDAAVAGERTIRLFLAPVQKGPVVEAAFDADGAPRGQSNIRLLSPPPAPYEPAEWIRTTAAFLLLIVFWQAMRRRTIVEPESLEKSGVVLAPLGRRFVAGIIDALPILITVIVVATSFRGEEEPTAEMVQVRMFPPYFISAAAYILHTFLTEWLLGWTIGKRILGLRAVMLDGSPLTARGAALRNVMRVVDVAMYLPPMLVLLSPLRQRVGDVAGETIVVLKDRKEVPQESE